MPDYKYLRLNRKDHRLWDWRDIDGHCPKCGSTDIEIMLVSVQFGFHEHDITAFGRCKHCAHHFVWKEQTRKSRKKISDWLQTFIEGVSSNGNQ